MRSKDAQKQLTQTSLKRQRDLLGIKKSGFNTSRSTAGTLLTRHLLEYWAQKNMTEENVLFQNSFLLVKKKPPATPAGSWYLLRFFFFKISAKDPHSFYMRVPPQGGGGGRRGRGKALRFSSSQLQVQNLLWQGFTSE